MWLSGLFCCSHARVGVGFCGLLLWRFIMSIQNLERAVNTENLRVHIVRTAVQEQELVSAADVRLRQKDVSKKRAEEKLRRMAPHSGGSLSSQKPFAHLDRVLGMDAVSTVSPVEFHVEQRVLAARRFICRFGSKEKLVCDLTDILYGSGVSDELTVGALDVAGLSAAEVFDAMPVRFRDGRKAAEVVEEALEADAVCASALQE